MGPRDGGGGVGGEQQQEQEIATYHPPSGWSFEVVPRFFDNLCALFNTRTLKPNTKQ
jgi:hypothetical protein